jgi:hypothetical protein
VLWQDSRVKQNLVEIRVNPRLFSREETQDQINCKFEYCSSYFVGLRFCKPQFNSVSDEVDLRPAIAHFCILIDMHRIDKQTNDLRLLHLRREQLC